MRQRFVRITGYAATAAVAIAAAAAAGGVGGGGGAAAAAAGAAAAAAAGGGGGVAAAGGDPMSEDLQTWCNSCGAWQVVVVGYCTGQEAVLDELFSG